MSTSAPASSFLGEAFSAVSSRWRSWARTALGLLVLAAIVGGLVAIDRLMGTATLGPLDSRAAEVGQPAPEFALSDPDGRTHSLSDFRGQVVWLNFWATWCGPCRRELPDIQRLADEFSADGLVVLAVNMGESADKARAFWDELDLELAILLDANGDVTEQYRARGLPTNYFIDEDGVLRGLHLGFLTEGQMRDRLADMGLS